MKWPILALLATLAPANAQVFSTGPQLVSPIIDSWRHGSRIIPSAGGTTLYGEFDASADWEVSQWSNPVSDLSSYSSVNCSVVAAFTGYTNCWQATSPNIIDTFGKDGSNVQWIDIFSAGGSTLPCSPASGQELDNFMSANGPYPHYPHAVTRNSRLNTLSNLNASVTVYPVGYSQISSRCSVTQSGLLLAITFTDATAGQVLFYQLHLADYPNGYGTAAFFSNKSPFGYRDNLWAGYGLYQNGVPTGQATTISINVLSRVESIISNATNGLDTTVANWQTGQANVGHNLWGDSQNETVWSGFTMGP